MSLNSENTAVYVHESRFPLRVLKYLATAGPEGIGSKVQRLDPLFRYEGNAQPVASTSFGHNNNVKSPHVPKLHSGSTSSTSFAGTRKGKERFLEEQPETSHTNSTSSGWDDAQSEILVFESPIAGIISEWCVSEGQYIDDPYQPILRIVEPCKHPVQLGGLCAVCGKDLTSVDYTGFSEISRASISMAHDTASLTVSLEEAARLEKSTTARLKRERKLSLIVDLDQTIIHATVDPTVGDWMFDAKNPNYPVLKDVKRFRLLDEKGKEEGCWYYVKPRPGLPDFLSEVSKSYEMHVYTMGTRQYAENVCRIIDPDGRYFANRILSRDESGSLIRKSLDRLFPVDQSMVVIIDDRADIWDWSPQLVKVVPFDFFVGIGDINSAFLPKQSSALTSAQTPSVASQTPSALESAEVDSRPAADVESAAISQQAETLDHQLTDKPLAKMQEEKSAALHDALEHMKQVDKLNPRSDSSMNIVPPDAASHASVSTQGDNTLGNSSLAPGTELSPNVTSHPQSLPTDDVVSDSSSDGSEDDTDSASVLDEADQGRSRLPAKYVKPSGVVNPGLTPAMPTASAEPIAEIASDGFEESADDHVAKETSQLAEAAVPIPPEEEAVLHEDDTELERVIELLGEIHRQFYESVDSERRDIARIVPRIKTNVLTGCHLVFSGVIPLNKEPRTSELWQVAEQFGAHCGTDITKRTTHVVAVKRGTSKVNQAARRKDVFIVTLSWLLQSVNLWRKEPESAYLLETGSTIGDGDPALPDDSDSISMHSDPNPDGNDAEDLEEFDWGNAEAEIQAFLEETDEEFGDTDNEEGIATLERIPSEHSNIGGKRSLSTTREAGTGAGERPLTPLAKRRRLAAARAGQSKLKFSENADLTDAAPAIEALNAHRESAEAAVRRRVTDLSDSDDEDGELDDFAKALEDELN